MSPEHVSETLAHKCACTRVCERRERECVCVGCESDCIPFIDFGIPGHVFGLVWNPFHDTHSQPLNAHTGR